MASTSPRESAPIRSSKMSWCDARTGALHVEPLNEFADETTYRLSGKVELDGQPGLSLSTMLAPNENPAPAPMQLAGWWADKFNRLYLNPVHTPRLKAVDATVDILPERRVATIENAWIPASEVEPGSQVPLKVFLRSRCWYRVAWQLTVSCGRPLKNAQSHLVWRYFFLAAHSPLTTRR